MITFREYCHLRESVQGGLEQVAGVGNDDENFHVKFAIKDLIAKAERYPETDIPIATLTPLLQGRQEDQSQTQARADAAELKYPIIVFANDMGKIFAIGDGTHRVQKAAALDMKSIKGHIIPKSDMTEFATEPNQYSKYYKQPQQPQQPQAPQQQVSSRIYDEPTLNEWLVLSGLCEQNVDINTVIQQYLNSDIGRKYENYDCKSVTRAFIQWAKKNGIQAQVLHLAPPSAEFVQKNPQFKGKSGEGDSHIMPVINGYAVDFTARQFGLNRPYSNPLITPISQVESVYGKFGYYTNNPDWFNGGKSFHLGSWESMPTIDTSFQDETL